MRAAVRGIVKAVLAGELAHRRSFAVLLADHLPAPADPLDLLLSDAAASSDPIPLDDELPDLEWLGLENAQWEALLRSPASRDTT